jgi:hypothetical protein
MSIDIDLNTLAKDELFSLKHKTALKRCQKHPYKCKECNKLISEGMEWCCQHTYKCVKCEARINNDNGLCEFHQTRCSVIGCHKSVLSFSFQKLCSLHVKRCEWCDKILFSKSSRLCPDHEELCSFSGCNERCSSRSGLRCSKHMHKCEECGKKLKKTKSGQTRCRDHIKKCRVRVCHNRISVLKDFCQQHQPKCVGCGKQNLTRWLGCICNECS